MAKLKINPSDGVKRRDSQTAQCERPFPSGDFVFFILLFVLWNIACYVTISFSGAYQNNYLGFSTVFSSVVIIIACILRAIFSKPFGRFADKHSFSKMLIICFSIEAVAFFVNIFTVPSNGSYMYMLFYMLYCVGQAGINSSIINLAYDYVPEEQKTGALALVNTCSGFTGFFTTLLVSPYQNHEALIEVANETAKKYGVKFLYRDFRPYFYEGKKMFKETGLYMQKYCGCVFSEEERYLKK